MQPALGQDTNTGSPDERTSLLLPGSRSSSSSDSSTGSSRALVSLTDGFVQDGILNKIAAYYLVKGKGASPTSRKEEVLTHLLLTTVSATSVLPYAQLAWRVKGASAVTKHALVAGGVTTNFCVTYNASEAGAGHLINLERPNELKQYLPKPKNQNGRYSHRLFIATAAFLSAFPVAASAFANSDHLSADLVAEVCVLQVDNSFLHLFPMLIIFKNEALKKAFLVPVYPFIFARKGIDRCLYPLTLQEKAARRQLVKKRKNQHTLKNALINTLEEARQIILDETFSHKAGINYDITLPATLKGLKHKSGLEALLTVVGFAKPLSKQKNNNGCQRFTHFLVHQVGGTIMYLFGAGLSNLGSVGFYKNAIDDLAFTRSRALQWLLASPANALLIVLVGYFGGGFFRDTLYKNGVSIFEGTYRAPQAFKRYPKTALSFLSVAIVAAKFSYGAALFLIQQCFSDELFDDIRPTLEFCATYGMPVFTFKNTLEFLLKRINGWAQRLGSDDNQASAQLDAAMTGLQDFIRRMDDDQFEKGLTQCTSEQRERLLRMTDAEFQKLIDHTEEVAHYESASGYRKLSEEDKEEKSNEDSINGI